MMRRWCGDGLISRFHIDRPAADWILDSIEQRGQAGKHFKIRVARGCKTGVMNILKRNRAQQIFSFRSEVSDDLCGQLLSISAAGSAG